MMSETESEMYSHKIIREVMEASNDGIIKVGRSRFGTILTELMRILRCIACL